MNLRLFFSPITTKFRFQVDRSEKWWCLHINWANKKRNSSVDIFKNVVKCRDILWFSFCYNLCLFSFEIWILFVEVFVTYWCYVLVIRLLLHTIKIAAPWSWIWELVHIAQRWSSFLAFVFALLSSMEHYYQ